VGEPERRDARGDRARRHEHHLMPGPAGGGDLAGEHADGGVVDRAARVGDRRRPDLHDDAHAVTPGTRS
jgi:hypothetical protein